jgi:hypothetical protein
MASKNFNEGKVKLSLVLKDMKNAVEEMARVRQAGIDKGYDRMNWAESIGQEDEKQFLEDNLDSIYRHLAALDDGLLDEESGCYHMAHIAVRACFALEYAMNGGKA